MCAVSRYTGTDSERVIASSDNWNWLFARNGQYYNRVAHLNGWVHPIDNTSLRITTTGTCTKSPSITRIVRTPGWMPYKLLRHQRPMIPIIGQRECSSMAGIGLVGRPIVSFPPVRSLNSSPSTGWFRNPTSQDRRLPCPQVGIDEHHVHRISPLLLQRSFRTHHHWGGEDATVTFY